MSLASEFTKGLWKEIPPFRLVLGLCPTLACTTKMYDGFGMGLALTFVLVMSNVIIALLKNVIPNKVRIACFIVVIATFVVIVERVTEAYVYGLYQSLGIFIPLIVVNCIVLGRAEAFASKRPLIDSLADGLGIGFGFTISLTVLGAIREIFGAGTILAGTGAVTTLIDPSLALSFMQKPPGAFVCLGIMLGLMNIVSRVMDLMAARKAVA